MLRLPALRRRWRLQWGLLRVWALVGALAMEHVAFDTDDEEGLASREVHVRPLLRVALHELSNVTDVSAFDVHVSQTKPEDVTIAARPRRVVGLVGVELNEGLAAQLGQPFVKEEPAKLANLRRLALRPAVVLERDRLH